MIYAKIYLDRDDRGKETLVFDSAKQSSADGYLNVAYAVSGRRRNTKTTVHDVSHVAISPEARALFGALLRDPTAYTAAFFDGDFEMIGCRDTQHGWDSGMFAFKPLPAEEGVTRRSLSPGEPFTVVTQVGFSPEVLDYMSILPNDELKALSLDT